MIDREFLEAQITDLQQQRVDAQSTLDKIAGALQMCRFLLAKLDEPTDAAQPGEPPETD